MRLMMVAATVAAACGPALAQDVSGAQQASQQFTSALSGGDAAGASAWFTDDAVALPPGRARLTGKAEIQRFLGAMTSNVQNLRYTSEEVRPITENVAREVGGFSFKSKGQNAQDVTGKYLIVWVKVGGDWKISTDMWNRNGGGEGQRRQGTRTGGRNGQGGGGSRQPEGDQ